MFEFPYDKIEQHDEYLPYINYERKPLGKVLVETWTYTVKQGQLFKQNVITHLNHYRTSYYYRALDGHKMVGPFKSLEIAHNTMAQNSN